MHAKGIEEVRRQVLNPIWNAWYFLSLYANVDGIRGRARTDAAGVLDRYILAKTASLVDDVTASMDAYDLFAACSAITALSRRPQQLVHPAQPRPVLAGPRRLARGRGRQGRRLRHLVHRARRRCARSAAPLLPAAHRSRSTGA